jgi:RNA polymerase primary sigma factor
LDIAYEYRNRGMNTEDLIQEGNFALIKALGELPEAIEEDGLTGHILNMVRAGICEALKDQQENDDFENIVIEKNNRIFQALKELEEKIGKKADIRELAEFMKLSEAEIMDTLELSGDSIKLEHAHTQDE